MCFTTHSWVNWRIRACLRGKIRARQFGIGISRCDERAVPRGRAMQRLTGTKRLDIGEALPGLSVAAPKGASRGAVAQLGERYTRTVEVGGSTPLGSTCGFLHCPSTRAELRPGSASSGRRNLMLLDEQRPVSTARGSRRPEVPEVPGQDERLSGLSHRHHHGVSQVEPRCFVPLEELESSTMLRVRWAVENVRAVK